MTSSTPGPIAPASAAELRSARRLSARKQRRERAEFLVEGPQAAREALAVPGLVSALFATSEAAARHADLIATADAAGVRLRVVDDQQLALLADTVHPQGIVAIARSIGTDLVTALAGDPRLVVICAQIRDPGNAGTVIRCADAFGADAVIMTEGSVELTSPKVARASVGSIFHLPIATGVPVADAIAACRDRGLAVYAADGSADRRTDQLAADGALARPTAWLFGNEAWGLPPADAALADARVAVPIRGSAESLNLATAAAVCLYASTTAQHPTGR